MNNVSLATKSIVDAATAVGLTAGGARAITVRSVATRAGCSPAAILYHFQSRDGLVRAVFEHVAAEVQAHRSDERSRLLTVEAPITSTAALVSGALCSLTTSIRPQLLLLEELTALSLLGDGNLGDLPVQENRHAEAFWRELISKCETEERHKATWTAFAMGVSWLSLLKLPLSIQAAWIFQTAERIAERLNGGTPVLRETPQATRSPPVAVRSPQEQRIVDAAISILGAGRAGDLTYRRLAAGAGITLAVSQKIDKSDLLLSAYQELNQRVIQADARTSAAIAFDVSRSLFNDAGQLLPEFNALRALHVLAGQGSRMEGLALQTSASRAAQGEAWLRRHSIIATDATDGWVWLTLLLGVVSRILLLPPDERPGSLDATIWELVGTLYPERDQP